MRRPRVSLLTSPRLNRLMVLHSYAVICGLLAACTTAGTPQSATETVSTSQTLASADDPSEEADRESGVLRVERENTENIRIMRDSCRGRYKVLADRDAKYPQMEIGIARAIGEPASDSKPSAPYPYIRYRCED